MSSNLPKPSHARDHLVRLTGDEFSAWRVILFRSAGFPAAWVTALANSDAVLAAERVFDAVEHANDERQLLQSRLELAVGRVSGEPHQRLIKALRLVRRGRMPKPSMGVDASAWQAALEVVADARGAFDGTHAAAELHTRHQLCMFGREDRLRRAITWQNRAALHLGIDKLLGSENIYNWRTRQYELLLANYIQRYCTKNECIGFFGPLAWANIDLDQSTMMVRQGGQLIKEQNVYFEGWTIVSLMSKLGEDPRLRPWLRPRRLPLVGLEGTHAYLPFTSKPIPLSSAQARLLRLCDGSRTAIHLAAEFSSGHDLARDEVFEVIDGLCKQGLAVWKLEVPLGLRPEVHLRQILDEISDEPVRLESLAKLDRLERARDAVALASDDSEALESNMAGLEEVFREVTGQSATRMPGKAYSGRTPVYLEARRDLEITVGKTVMDIAGPVLSLLMRGVRWFTHEAGKLYRHALLELHQTLVAQTSQKEIPFLRFWMAAQPLFNLRPSSRSAPPAHIRELVTLFTRRWEQILGNPDHEVQRLSYRCDDLRPAVLKLFDAPGPGWNPARYSTPDLMIDAPSAEAIENGAFRLVLGEFAMAALGLMTQAAYAHHPDPESLFQMVDGDHDQPLFYPLIPSSMFPARVHIYMSNQNGYELAWSPEMPIFTRGNRLLAGDVVVAQHDDNVIACTRDSRLHVDVLEVFALALSTTCASLLSLLSSTPHVPRIEIDRVVVQRETWRVPVTELEFAHSKTAGQRYLAALSYAKRRDLPREMFVRTPAEEKPIYVALDCPVLVESLCKAIRKAAKHHSQAFLTLSEMLPGREGLWLSDRDGNRYTSEFRLTVVDPLRPA